MTKTTTTLPPVRAVSPELLAFLKDWRAWVNRGAPQAKPYWRQYGLRNALDRYKRFSTDKEVLSRAFDELFRASGSQYPFGRDEYWARYDARTQHKDPNRLAWVDAMIAFNERGEA